MPHADPNAPIGRRAALTTLGALAAGAALWPRAPRSRASIPAGRVVLEYWEKWTGSEGEALDAVIHRFNSTQDRIWVRRVPVADIVPKAMVAIAGGDPPDLVGLYSFNIPQLAESRAALAFDEIAPGNNRLDPDIYAPAVRRLLTYQSRQWAAVTSCYSLGLYCNLSHFKEAGLDASHMPRTIRELDQLSERLTVRDASGALTRTGFQQNLPQWWPYFWPVCFGGALYDANSNRATLADASGLAAFNWIQQTAARLGVEQSRALARVFDRSYHTAGDPFFSGRASMIIQGPWLASFARLHAPQLEFACVPPPVDAPLLDPAAPLGMVEADVLIIPRGCPHPHEAWEFVTFMQRQDVQEELCKAHGKSSPLQAVSPEFMSSHPNRAVRVFDSIVKSERALVLPQTRVWQQYADMTSGLFDQAWAGLPVGPAITQVQTRAQQLMDQASRRRAQRAGDAA